jgi:hypothetical protein
MGHRRPDGSTLREHLQSAAAKGERVDPTLLRRVPAEAAALWDAFVSMSGSRPIHQGGAGSIPPTEIAAWQQLHGVRLTPWELDTLARIDRAALAEMARLTATERQA